jgi:hypothetical protein
VARSSCGANLKEEKFGYDGAFSYCTTHVMNWWVAIMDKKRDVP